VDKCMYKNFRPGCYLIDPEGGFLRSGRNECGFYPLLRSLLKRANLLPPCHVPTRGGQCAKIRVDREQTLVEQRGGCLSYWDDGTKTILDKAHLGGRNQQGSSVVFQFE
jgi:hypothetical protein